MGTHWQQASSNFTSWWHGLHEWMAHFSHSNLQFSVNMHVSTQSSPDGEGNWNNDETEKKFLSWKKRLVFLRNDKWWWWGRSYSCKGFDLPWTSNVFPCLVSSHLHSSGCTQIPSLFLTLPPGHPQQSPCSSGSTISIGGHPFPARTCSHVTLARQYVTTSSGWHLNGPPNM